MTVRSTLFLALALLATAPLALAGPGPDVEGRVLLGTGRLAVEGVDHERHAVPEGAVGIVFPREVTTQGGSPPCAGCGPLFARVADCPEGMACTQELRPGCLAVYATPGAVRVPYAFSWTRDPAQADLLLDKVPHAAPLGAAGCA